MTRYEPPRRSWFRKFADAFRGLAQGVLGQSSFLVHIPCAIAVVACGAWLRVSVSEWCLLVLCITLVLSAELFNSALEHLAKAIDPQENEHLAIALNIASSAVLVAALGAVAIGAMVFVPRVMTLVLGQ